MARTRASVGAKISSGKSNKARCNVAPPPTSGGNGGGTERASRSTGGGNPMCPRETPKWQRAITTFFITKPSEKDEAEASSSKPKQKRNIIQSDDEDDKETPKNTELDETIDLEPLTGDDSHKIEEYYPINGVKGKGVGKKSKDKENVNDNIIEKCKKREREDTLEESVSKKVKI